MAGNPGHACGVLCADADPVGGDRDGAGAVDEALTRQGLARARFSCRFHKHTKIFRTGRGSVFFMYFHTKL